MTRLVPVTGQIIMPAGHAYADATWRYGTEIAGGFQVAGGAQKWKVVEIIPGSGLGELRTLDNQVPQVLVHDIGDFVPRQPWAQLEVRFRGAAVGYEKRIPLVLTREETSLRIDKQMANTRLIELTRDSAVFLNWRFDAENYILVDGVYESIVALTPKDKFKGHRHVFEDITGLNTALNNRALESSVASRLAGKADLVNGKIPTSQLPGAAITDIFFPSSDAAMLALDAQPGDIAVRTDKGNLRYELTGDPTNLDHWSPQFPAGADGSAATGVTSINTMRGDVILGYGDVGAAPANHTHTHSSITDWNTEVDKRAQYNVVGEPNGGITATWDNTTRQQKLRVNGAHSGFNTALLTALLAGTGITVTPDPTTGRPVIAVSGSGGWVDWNDVANKPTQYAPENHAARHRTGGPDALTPADIGAAPVQHSHTLAALGAAAAQHQHAAADMPELAEFVRDTMGMALAGAGGIKVTNNDAGDQILISADGVVGVTLEEADGAPSLSASKIVVPAGSLTQLSPGVVQLNVASSGGSTGGTVSAYTPTYKRTLTALNPFPARTDLVIRAVVRTAFAQSDGRDFTVYTQGGVALPTNVQNVVAGQNYKDYYISWADTLNGSEQRTYTVKYGDAYAPERQTYTDNLSRLLSRPTAYAGNISAALDNSVAYRSPDFLTASSAVVQTTNPQVISTVPTMLGGVQGSGLSLANASTSQFTTADTAGRLELVPSNGAVKPALIMGFQYVSPLTVAAATTGTGSGLCAVGRALSDGYALDYRSTSSNGTGPGGVGVGYSDYTVRYRAGMGWIWTAHHVEGTPAVYSDSFGVRDATGGNGIKFFGTGGLAVYNKPNRNDPSTWISFTIDFIRQAQATSGDETAITP